VGLFADDNNARNAYVKLMDAGLPAFKQAFNTSKGKRTRVRVGPFETEAQAEINANRIQTLGLEAQVFESASVIDTSGN
jgi:cell division septation protein DedD